LESPRAPAAASCPRDLALSRRRRGGGARKPIFGLGSLIFWMPAVIVTVSSQESGTSVTSTKRG
jgi:hypothetical protein